MAFQVKVRIRSARPQMASRNLLPFVWYPIWNGHALPCDPHNPAIFEWLMDLAHHGGYIGAKEIGVWKFQILGNTRGIGFYNIRKLKIEKTLKMTYWKEW